MEINLKELKYPLFKTNWWEKLLLRGARWQLKRRIGSHFLCFRVSDYPFSFELRRKISRSCMGNLSHWILFHTPQVLLVEDLKYEARIEWVNQLLEYKGE